MEIVFVCLVAGFALVGTARYLRRLWRDFRVGI